LFIASDVLSETNKALFMTDKALSVANDVLFIIYNALPETNKALFMKDKVLFILKFIN
jgi:hypothetical protein